MSRSRNHQRSRRFPNSGWARARGDRMLAARWADVDHFEAYEANERPRAPTARIELTAALDPITRSRLSGSTVPRDNRMVMIDYAVGTEKWPWPGERTRRDRPRTKRCRYDDIQQLADAITENPPTGG